MHPPTALGSTPRIESPSEVTKAPQSTPWLRRFFTANIDWFKFRLAIAGMDVAFGKRGLFWGLLWVQGAWQSLTGVLRVGSMSNSFEGDGDLVQEQIMAMGQEFGVEIDETVFRG